MQAVSPSTPVRTAQHPLTREVFGTLLVLQGRLVDLLDRELESACGIGLGEFLVLHHLDSAPEGRVRLSELADAALVSRSALSRRVDRLVEAEWVVRRGCPTDRRGTYAVITEAGRTVARRAEPVVVATLDGALGSRLTPEELRQLGNLLAKALEGVDASD
ncbi:transcriptional regulator, MarR family [Acidimicrobium ferrooxidans DSM 10331]|uniref:Transcriptional regulator, MarR family n=1 Tax=Acidimicrobium ferrooxidans (strain DSM 10331 / JCM 15462 / NBRC 103882 / ICP) TaxID=525909 RepID=C7M0X9_ACIFD|nr:MarR family transcriptional regulator [Acidimicrobium ferrooxidans]ACU54637.1 transcriptional regulator, MarR family [Acidimicrobium ferrooxidans DSM 10331]